MKPSNARKSQIAWALTGALLLSGACSTAEYETAEDSAEVESVSQSLESLSSAETNELKAFVAEISKSTFNPKFKVVPILNCVEKISSSQYIARFGYNNKNSSTTTINVGLLNRFFPSPSNRGQPTKFSTGTKNEVFKVPFNGSLIVWGVDGNFTLAHHTSKLCPTVPPPVCKTNCDDKNPCTADICDASTKWVCTHKNLSKGTSCADANACNGTETCDGAGKCKAGTTLVCNDNSTCTTDKCDMKLGCMFTPVSDGTSCAASGNCGAGGACTAGKCVPKGQNCNDNKPCTVDTCVNGTTCKFTVRPAGSSCTDGNFCNGAETCNATGVCGNGAPPTCDDQNPCTVNSCETAGGCGFVPGNEGGACTLAAGGPGVCKAGACASNGVVCTPSTDPCKVNVLVNGVCVVQNAADDVVCSDGNACTQTDVCKSGVCTGSNPKVCSGASGCTEAGVCNPSTGLCVGTPKPAGTSCDDGSLCTTGDVCNATGQCTGGTPKVCAAQDACHTAGVCDAATGLCSNPNAANGTSCNDGLKCTSTDVCTNGLCGGAPVVCTALDACHTVGTCDEISGACSNPVAAAGTSCSDGNLCTQSDTCNATGVCVAGAPVSCTGAGACTDAGSCNPATGTCSGGTPKPNGTSCDDGIKCTTSDVCTSGTCGGAAVVCAAPSDACHVRATCDESTGVCPASPAAPVGTSCNDGNACTQTDACAAGGVCAGANPVQCDGGTACTEAGVCSPSTGLCVGGVPKPNTTPCDDGKMCTTLDRCNNGTCGGTPTVCPAPTGACKVQGVCQEPTGACTTPDAPNGTTCSDGLNCTTADKCTSGACAGTAVTCPAPSDACHLQGVCQESSGTCNAPVAPVGTSCSDGLACTAGDTCNASGSCTAGGPKCAPGETCGEPDGTCTPGTPVETACDICVRENTEAGNCDPSGCELITTGAADVALCQALRTCMDTKVPPANALYCWDQKPLDCLCGSALGASCASDAANGFCKAEIRAAAKSAPGDNVTPGTRFFSQAFPIGFATVRYACILDNCASVCK